MPIYTQAEYGRDRAGWFVLFITTDPATPNFRSAMPDEPTARQCAAAFRAVAVCAEIVRRANPESGARAEFANGRGTLAGVSLNAEQVVNAAEAVEIATGAKPEIVIDRILPFEKLMAMVDSGPLPTRPVPADAKPAKA